MDFRRLHDVATACCKADGADVPEVQAVIRLLLPTILAAWHSILDSMLSEAERQVRRATGENFRPSDLALLLAAYVTALQRLGTLPFSAAARRRIEAAVETLADAGASLAGLPAAPGLALAQSLGASQLSLMLEDLVDRKAQESAAAASRFVQEDLGRVGTEQSIQAWRDELRAALDAEAVLLPLVDAWAYQTFNVATIRAAAAAGENFIMLQAVVDDHTTMFCRLVNGRVVPMQRVLDQLDRIQTAILAADGPALRTAAPFFSRPDQATQADVDAALANGGLAPFHFGCRTKNVPVRLPAP